MSLESPFSKTIRNLKQGTLLKNGSKAIRHRFIKYVRYSNLLYIFDKNRVRTKGYQKDIPKIDSNHFLAGNYYLDKRAPINKDSIVYSLGILTDISFDLHVSEQYSCKVFMYDPTPTCIEFMKAHSSNSLLKFFPLGVWTESTQLKFFKPKHGGSASAMDQHENDDYFLADCRTMQDIMITNNHSTIDVFKADIEGAALPILEQMIKQGIFPNQIIVEFERPQNSQTEIDDFFNRVTNLRNQLKEQNYVEFFLPRGIAKYFSLELLFVKK